MFGISLSNCGVVIWHQIVIVFAIISQQVNMFLGRSESLKWIRRKFSKRNNSNSTAAIEHTPAKISKTHNENCENIRDLNEILVITNPTPKTLHSAQTPLPQLTTIHSDEVMSKTTTMLPSTSTSTDHSQSALSAPIAREEECAEEVEEEEWSTERQIDNVDMLQTNNAKQPHESDQQRELQTQLQLQDQAIDMINETLVRRSKASRVRNYLRKCKDRWLAVANDGHNAELNHQHSGHDPISTTTTTERETATTTNLSTVIESNVSQHPPRPVEITTNDSMTTEPIGDDAAANAGNTEGTTTTSHTTRRHYRRHSHGYPNCALGSVVEIEDDEVDDADGYYEDIDFGLSGYTIESGTTSPFRKDESLISRTQANNVVANAQQVRGEEMQKKLPKFHDDDHEVVKEIDGKHLIDSLQMESQIAALIDSHLACIYHPVFNQTTRAVLIREARDVLLKSYHGCLTTFQRQFLCKFAEIADMLKQRHRIGEALIWCQGWPLATPIGEVILHLGDLDDDQLKPAEIYLCVKTVDANHVPQLYATWRTPTAQQSICNTNNAATSAIEERATTTPELGSTLKSCQLDYQDNTLYLSTLTLEMLNDDLPQLLQSLLIGVEHNLERLSLNQLPQTAVPTNYDPINHHLNPDLTSSSTPINGNNNKNNINNNNTPNAAMTPMQIMKTQIPNSPKCGLRRSELITKNKLHNNKYMLRRFTNRQDSMNSTSSGNSSASGLSTASSSSSDSPSFGKTHLINTTNTNNNVNMKNGNETKSNDCTNTSPALPRFCLGTSFPHIDSDEENAEERRHSLTDDQLESEIIPPNLITDLPEKLLLSGIYLPGTRDMKGNPLVTVDAESVLAAGLNCYEVATLLLYYSTIPERSVQNNNNLSGGNVEISNSPQRSSNHSATAATTATTSAIQSSTSSSSSSSATSTTTALTTSATTTCTSLNDNVQQQQQPQQHQQQQSEQLPKQHQQQHVTFSILIAIEKSQHLCVIDLISQSLKLLTRHIAYCHLLAVCMDSTLLLNADAANSGAATTTANEDVKAATSTTNTINEKPSTLDSNGNWRCHKKTETHTITYLGMDEVTTSGGVAPTATPSGRFGGLHHHDARKWREFFVHYEPFYQQCAGAAQRLVAALNDIRHADLQGLPTRRQLYAQHRALSRALMDSELHNLRKRSAATMARLQELAKSINGNSSCGGSIASNGGTKANSYCSIKSKASNIGGVVGSGGTSTYYSTTINRSKIMGGGGSSSYSFNYQGNQNNKSNGNNSQNSHNVPTTATKSSATTTSSSTPIAALQMATTAANPLIKSSIYSTTSSSSSSSSSSVPTTTSRLSATNIQSHNQSINGSVFAFACLANNHNYSAATATAMPIANMDVVIRLQKVSLLFTEIDRAAKRLEQLTEQRREHLRELTRQRALEDEINEVTSWITNDGSESLQRFVNLELDWDTPMKEREHEFEKYYFISMKNLAKGRDLHVAASNMDSLKESAIHLKNALDCFAEKLESARERIEGATRLHHLLHMSGHDEGGQQEIERLAEHCGVKGLLEKCHGKDITDDGYKRKPESLNLNYSNNNNVQKSTNVPSQVVSSTPDSHKVRSMVCQRSSSYGIGSYENPPSICHCWRDSRNLDDDIEDDMMDNDEEEGQSKIADSGVGECQRCEGNPKLTRMCSCQSLNEESDNLYKKHDELDDECFEQPSKCYINIHSPLEANKHLQCFASTFELPTLEELSCLDPKIQKTLLLIMREMIGTERDYVRSLYYVIDNYIDELLRDDIPQSMRGQRNVIFGNIEKIFEFHNNHFLTELERYENNPLKVGAAFLQMESQFYLYALYNKNKPKSDTLMSEYGTAFFKSKQLELNDKMDLASYLLKPVQRMGKYALLLQQLVKACNTVEGSAMQEIAADVEELQKAEEMVKFQLRHGNDLLAMDSLRDCDVNVKEQGRLLRQNEFLVWQGRGGKKTLRHIFLFEELVLFSKARRFPDHKNLDIYIYKNSIKTSDIGLTAHVGDSPTKFEIWFRKRKPEDTWTLQCMSEDIKNVWTEEISKLLWQQAKRNREIRLAEMSSMGIGSKPCLDIRPSNNQINDRSITISQLGKAPKLRHSFVGLHSDQMKTSRRPNSLISESSLSSGTSSSSLSKSSTTSSASSAHQQQHHHQPTNGLELITESQTLSLDHNEGVVKCHNHPHSSHTLSSGYSNHGGGSTGGGTVNSRAHRNNHKRSTTIVSQMSMESGIISDICMTPDQDNNEIISTWPSNPTDAHHTPLSCSHSHNNNNNNSGNKFVFKCHSYNTNTLGKKCENLQHYKDTKSEHEEQDHQHQHHQKQQS